ncbi:MAG: hypothetical protein KGK01_08745 [Bradyrhizobium sp.]|uniref:hypothetical protein n=1 Tax=Bradyrhizobium sp. TaxID=376 RepID=UPI001C28EF07|nr:hypothetical protein [Bradyrhizobium sp.]MBU6464190.1 hypothetical protein [Pseudomonadota bacterium]MDE2067902.1 hypothetical protein [Bradyrhizobium sp.]MDE2242513.1 hypothetical protein [Bradyrhizobium sp.]MDE2468599.1 hypothetical protein [Bradyrhizobium sp.]
MPEKDLNKLSRMIEDSLAVAVEIDETTTIYLLSMASLQVTEKIKEANDIRPRNTE